MKAHKNDLKSQVLTVKEAYEKLSEEEFKEIAQDDILSAIVEDLVEKGILRVHPKLPKNRPTIKSVMEQYKVSRIYAKNMIFMYYGKHYDGAGFQGSFDDFVKREIKKDFPEMH